MIKYRGTKVELDDGREIVVPGFFYLEARKHAMALADAGVNADEYVLDALAELVQRNHPEVTREDLARNAVPTIHALWAAGMRTRNEDTVPGEAQRRPS